MNIPGEVVVNKYIFCLEWWFLAVDSKKENNNEGNKVIQAINCILNVKTRMCTLVPIKNQHSKPQSFQRIDFEEHAFLRFEILYKMETTWKGSYQISR